MGKHPPTLITDRLHLRPFLTDDAPQVQNLAGAREVYATTLTVPHPYEDGMAERWIASHHMQFYSGKGVVLAVTLKGNGQPLVGAVSLSVVPQHQRAELGYWIGVPYWGNGYCTEAAIAMIEYGFETLALHKISARHMSGNPASGRVMVKAGMKYEGELADEVLKDGAFRTLVVYGLVKS